MVGISQTKSQKMHQNQKVDWSKEQCWKSNIVLLRGERFGWTFHQSSMNICFSKTRVHSGQCQRHLKKIGLFQDPPQVQEQ